MVAVKPRKNQIISPKGRFFFPLTRSKLSFPSLPLSLFQTSRPLMFLLPPRKKAAFFLFLFFSSPLQALSPPTPSPVVPIYRNTVSRARPENVRRKLNEQFVTGRRQGFASNHGSLLPPPPSPATSCAGR